MPKKRRRKIMDYVSVFIIICAFIFCSAMVLTLVGDLVQRPASVEIYTYPLCEWMESDGGLNWNKTFCNIEGCRIENISHVSKQWHYFLFGIPDVVYMLVLFTFLAGISFAFLMVVVFDAVESEHKKK